MADTADECRNKECSWCHKEYAYFLMVGDLCQFCAEDDEVCNAIEREEAMDNERVS